MALTVDVVMITFLLAVVSATTDTCESTVCATLHTVHKSVPRYVSRVEKKLCASIKTTEQAAVCSSVLKSNLANLLKEKMVTRKAANNCAGDHHQLDRDCDNTLACKTINFISSSMPAYLTDVERQLCSAQRSETACRKFLTAYRQQLVTALQTELATETSFLNCNAFDED